MRKILLIHGPNLNLLGQREKNHYGDLTLVSLEDLVKTEAKKNDLEVICFQSNHEGELIDFIQEKTAEVDGIIINPGALTHYSYALHDCLVDTGLPCVEVHLSDVDNREEWRKISVTAPACIAKISGKKEQGYIDALNLLKAYKADNAN
ncbi:MAG TPA: type II 3-dehydroquinate dehydratase [Candidatus Magasanikbacteria bacterium]|nr:type II 3-dehydroquinate dehydratase [Candidatus Magasanikbacteria bacterium]